VKDGYVKLRVSAEEREAWQRSANVVGLSLSAYVRRCLEETQALEHVLDRQLEDARKERTRREQVEQTAPRPPRRPGMATAPRRPRTITVGEALRQADANAGRGGPIL
jgi:hypothetical protein